MGSTGTDRLSDLPGARARGAAGGGVNAGGGEPCERIVDCALDDVIAQSQYVSTGALPEVGDAAEVDPTPSESRLVVVADDGTTLGFLPSEFSTLVLCLEEWTYRGAVTSVTSAPLPAIRVRLDPARRV